MSTIPSEPLPPQPKRVAICGFASSSRAQAPFDDPNYDIWTMNHAPLSWIPRWDLLFELHTMDHLRRVAAHQTTPTEYLEWIQKQPGPGEDGYKPIYMQKTEAEVKASVEFPRAELNAWFLDKAKMSLDALVPAPKDAKGWYADDYYTSTISYMLALAIRQHRPVIELYGVDLLQDDEYCIGPETRVLTADLRWVQAGTLKVGDTLVGFDEEPKPGLPYRRWRTARVDVVQRLRRPSRRIHTSDGKTIMCSAEHRWLTRCGGMHRWRTTDELVYPGHRRYQKGRPSRLYKLCDTWTEDRSWDAGYLAAAFDGEGNLCQTAHRECRAFNARLSFAQRENAMAQEVREAIERCKFRMHAGGKQGDCIQYVLQGGRVEVLRFLGTIRPRRLLDHFCVDALGSVKLNGEADVVLVEDVGEQEVIGLRTSTKTFVAEGFATHNSYQRAGAEYLIGFARGMGIPVYIPEQSALCKANFTYGISELPTSMGALQPLLDYIDSKAKAADEMLSKAHNDAHLYNGAIQMTDLVLKWLTTPEEGKTLEESINAKRVDLVTKLNVVQQNSLVMQGQAEAFRTSVVWSKHFARGGELKP